MVDRRDRGPSRTTRRPTRASAAGRKSSRASAGRTAKPKGRAKTVRRAKPAGRKTAAKPAARRRGTPPRKSAAATRKVSRRGTTTTAPATPTPTLPERVAASPQSQVATLAPAPPAVNADIGVVVRRRRRRGPRVKFTRWLYSEDLYRQLGVSPRGQALVCRELRAERDGSWSARVAAVPAGFFEPTWVTVPPEVVVPVSRPKPVDAAR